MCWVGTRLSFFFFAWPKFTGRIKIVYIFVKERYICTLMPRSRSGSNHLSWMGAAWKEKEFSFTPAVAWETVKAQIWFCLSIVPVFK